MLKSLSYRSDLGIAFLKPFNISTFQLILNFVMILR